jgi:hypothetical protein
MWTVHDNFGLTLFKPLATITILGIISVSFHQIMDTTLSYSTFGASKKNKQELLTRASIPWIKLSCLFGKPAR